MSDDLQERVRRSLATRADDVRPDPATWARVEARIRRRTWARWSLAGLTAAAALVLAALTLPGLFSGTRVDLSPADPGPAAAGATHLVTTDGRSLHVRDLAGEVLAEIEPPADADDLLPITRIATRPGSTPEDLTVVLLRGDCEEFAVDWVTASKAGGIAGGGLVTGSGYCVTAPVWSPEGDTVAWIDSSPAGTAALQVYGWGPDGPGTGDPATDNARFDLDLPAATAVRATDWWWYRSDGTAAAGVVSLSVVGADDTAQAFALAVERQADGAVALPGAAPAPVDTGWGDAVRSVAIVWSHDRSSGLGGNGYELGIDADATVLLSRFPWSGQPLRIPLDPGVLAATDVDRGDAWLAARGDTVVFGAGGSGWLLDFPAGAYTALPGVVHAAVMAPAGDPAPTPATPDPGQPGTRPAVDLVAIDGDGLTVTTRGERMTISGQGNETDLAVRPGSTPDDYTVVWRAGTGCDATLRYARVAGGDVAEDGTVPADCPGRPAFSPDGRHLAWLSDTDRTASGEFGLETLAWRDGPGDSLTTFGLPADPDEIGHLTLLDWTWEGDRAQAGGLLHLAGSDSHGTVSALTAPIERQGDGALALPAGATAEQVTPFGGADQDRFAILQAASGVSGGAFFELVERPGNPDAELAVARYSEADRTVNELVLPPDLLRVNTTDEVDDVWMTARGDDVLLGDGAGRAWSVRWTAGQWGPLQPLGGDVRFAVLLPDHPPAPTGSRPVPGLGDPDVSEREAEGSDAGLPDAVAATRQAILEAAAAGDAVRLAELAGDGFTSSFGGPEDPLVFFTRLRDERELDRLVRILQLPHGAADGLYSWPFAHTHDLASLSSAELSLLQTVATQEEIDRWTELGSGWLGWRAGIDADGTWRFYVAGD